MRQRNTIGNIERTPTRARIGASLLAAILFTAGCGAVEWDQFQSSEGGFTVNMPGNPAVQTNVLNTPVGALDLHLFSGEANDMRYVVGYCDYPDRLLRNVDAEELLTNVREGTVAAAHGALVGESRISRGTYPGREIRISLPDSLIEGGGGYRSHLYVVEGRLYQIAVSAPKNRAFSAEADSFFNSFRLINR